MQNYIGVGRITKDLPTLRFTKDNKAVLDLSVAISNGKDDTTFINMTAFGKTAENCSKYLQKGKLIGFNAIIKNHNWEDKNGVKKYDYSFIANDITFLSSKEEPKEDMPQEIYAEQQQDPFSEFGKENQEQLLDLPF